MVNIINKYHNGVGMGLKTNSETVTTVAETANTARKLIFSSKTVNWIYMIMFLNVINTVVFEPVPTS